MPPFRPLLDIRALFLLITTISLLFFTQPIHAITCIPCRNQAGATACGKATSTSGEQTFNASDPTNLPCLCPVDSSKNATELLQPYFTALDACLTNPSGDIKNTAGCTTAAVNDENQWIRDTCENYWGGLAADSSDSVTVTKSEGQTGGFRTSTSVVSGDGGRSTATVEVGGADPVTVQTSTRAAASSTASSSAGKGSSAAAKTTATSGSASTASATAEPSSHGTSTSKAAALGAGITIGCCAAVAGLASIFFINKRRRKRRRVEREREEMLEQQRQRESQQTYDAKDGYGFKPRPPLLELDGVEEERREMGNDTQRVEMGVDTAAVPELVAQGVEPVEVEGRELERIGGEDGPGEGVSDSGGLEEGGGSQQHARVSASSGVSKFSEEGLDGK